MRRFFLCLGLGTGICRPSLAATVKAAALRQGKQDRRTPSETRITVVWRVSLDLFASKSETRAVQKVRRVVLLVRKPL